jgi:GDP-4-dehydro-6-deoxy-D-mannose reductase
VADQNTQPTILITGGTGFAGTHLIEALQKKGYTNIHATHFGKNTILPNTEGVAFHQLDLTQAEDTLAVFEKVRPDHIYNLASFAAVSKSFERAAMLLQNNITLQLNVLQTMKRVSPTSRLLVIGSAEEYGLVQQSDTQTIDESFPLNPDNPYGVSKVAQDLLANSYHIAYKLPIIRVRPFNHIGEHQVPDFVVPAFASQIASIEKNTQEKLMVGNLEAVRDFTDVKDMVQAYILLMEKGIPGEVYNVGTGKGWKIRQILDTLIQLANVPIQVEQDPNRLRPSDIPYFVANISKISALGWKPSIPIEQTLERILNEWRTTV